ncbi:MAG: carboxypeptidase [Bacteroidota bacterium]
MHAQRMLPVDTMIKTQHEVTINGQAIEYTATTGTQPVYGEDDTPIASLHYTYYSRNGIADRSKRPLLISFNGGPGSASAWMHLAYTGPKSLRIDEEGYPVQPYGVMDNPYSVLDVTDIVFVNPVNTGYSRMIPANGEGLDRETFFGVNADIAYLAEWLNLFVTRQGRWRSPKYLVGESYGGTRVAGLAYALQNSQWMYLNGVIMVSPADYKVLRRGGPVADAIPLPYFAAAAWHHKVLPPELQGKDLEEMLPEVEAFTVDELMPALAKGGRLPTAERKEIASAVARYSGLSIDQVLDNNLRIPTAYFWKHLLKEDGFTVGRLDSRYLGIDGKGAGIRPDFSTELVSWLHSFTPAINYYLREELGFKTDIKYNMFGPVRPWDDSDDETREQLRMALAMNPYLHVLYQAGYYDGATTYFNTKYSMSQLDLSGQLQDRLDFKGYRSGHMMYLRREDLKKANDDLRAFIDKTATGGRSARYLRD